MRQLRDIPAGKFEIEAPSDFSEGSEVRIWLDRTHGDDDGSMSQEEIDLTLEAMFEVQPFILTEAERREWQRSLDEQKAVDIAAAENRIGKPKCHRG